MNDHWNGGGNQLTASTALKAKESLSKMTMPSNPIQPPPHLHPLHILDTYLISILKNPQHDDTNSCGSGSVINQQFDIGSILQTCEFLFSQDHCHFSSHSSYSLLESALELLDDSNSNSNSCSNRNNKFQSSPSHFSSTRPEFTPAVRLIRSSSGRRMIVVRGSSSSASSSLSSLSLAKTSPSSPLSSSNTKSQGMRWGDHNNGNNSYSNKRKNFSQNQHSCSEYLITLGTTTRDTSATLNNNDDGDDNGGNKSKYNNALNNFMIGKMGYHCTCRSFYERLKRPRRASNSNTTHGHDHDRFVICKHLLAARIAPFLHCEGTNSSQAQENDGKEGQHLMQSQSQSQQQQCGNNRILCYREEEVTDEEFARMYINLSMSLWT